MFSGVPNGPLRLSPPQVHAAVHNSGDHAPGDRPFRGESEDGGSSRSGGADGYAGSVATQLTGCRYAGVTAVGKTGLPFGNLSRLLLAWVSTEAVRTQSRELFLGASLSEFMRKLGLAPVGGGSRGERTRVHKQMRAALQRSYPAGLRRSAGLGQRQLAAGQPDRVLVEPQAARRADAVGEQDRAGREVFPGGPCCIAWWRMRRLSRG